MAAPARAQEGKRHYDLPAQNADQALKQFSEQSGQGLLVESSTVKKVRTNAVKGDYTAREALDQLLDGTGLVASRDSENGAFAIRRETPAELKNVNRAIAQDSGRPERNGKTDVDANGEPVVKLDTFEVFGKKTLNMDIQRTQDDVQPYVVFDRSTIERSGAVSLDDFFQRNLPSAQVTARTNEGTYASNIPIPNIALRGLGFDETLILVDGRRYPKSYSGGTQFSSNINGIPLSAIERIDVLPVTASGIYGGGATGGVINIILRRDYSGAELALTYGNAFDTDVAIRRAELSGGFTFEKGKSSLNFFASWSDGTALVARDRDYRAQYFTRNLAALPVTDPLSIYGQPVPIFGATSNIRSALGGNLTLKAKYGGAALNSPITSIPYGYSGPTSDNGAGLVARAGKYNLDNPSTAQGDGGGTTLSQAPQQRNYLLTLRREMTAMLSLYAEGSLSVADTAFAKTPTIFFTLAPTDAANPFNEQIRVTTPFIGAETVSTSRYVTARLATGAILQLPSDWKVSVDVTWTRTTLDSKNAPTVFTSVTAPAVSNGTLDVFRDTNAFPINFAPYLGIANRFIDSRAISTDAAVRASGPVGLISVLRKATLSSLVEYQQDIYPETRNALANAAGGITNSIYPRRTQSTASGYVELRWPIFGPADQVNGIESLELLAAGRYDRYRVTGVTNSVSLDANGNPTSPIDYRQNTNASINPTIGLKYSPIKFLTMRGSFGTGFLAPVANQLVPRLATSPTNLSFVTDPQRGNEPLGLISITSGGNAGLRPERTQSWSAGTVLTPRAVPGLRLSVDWVRLDKDDAISAWGIPTTAARMLEFLTITPERVTRGDPSGGFAVGPITALDTTLINLTELHVQAFDYALDYSKSLSFGTIDLSAKATHNRALIQKPTPAAPKTYEEGTVNVPYWRGNVSLGWRKGNWEASWATRYLSATYFDAAHSVSSALNSAELPAQCYHDFFVSYQFGSQAPLLLRNTQVSVTVNNIFNTDAPMTYYQPYRDVFGDLRGANYIITLRRQF